MPYSGIKDKKTVEKLDKCVLDVMRQGGSDKSKAIAICRHSIGASQEEAESMIEELSATASQTLELTNVDESERAGLNAMFGATLPSGEIVKFTNAILCRSEVNKNHDGMTTDGIQQLADSLPLMPLDIEHRQKQIVGFFTAARAVDWHQSTGSVVTGGALSTDGVIYAGRFPDVAAGVSSGKLKLSVESWASRAVCGECSEVFDRPSLYCAHLKEKKATRWLFDLKAAGGGVTENPAGTDTAFSAENGFVVIASSAEAAVAPPDDELEAEPTVNDDTKKKKKKKLDKTEEEMELEELKATLATVQAQLSELQAKYGESERALIEARAANEAAKQYVEVVARRALVLTETMPVRDVDARIPMIASMDENAWGVLIEMQKAFSAGARQPVVASLSVGQGVPSKVEASDNGLFSFTIKED